jgi:transposase-like protein
MALFKLLYLVHHNIKGQWNIKMQGWKLTFAQMTILFEERMNQP